MDSIDDSPLMSVLVRVADIYDNFQTRIVSSKFLAAILCGILGTYYSAVGGRGDVVLVGIHTVISSRRLERYLLRHKQIVLATIVFAVFNIVALRLITLFSSASRPWRDSAGSVFIPSRTTHTRFFPKKHSFAYSYLTVGVPVGLRSHVNGILSTDPPTSSIAGGWWTWLVSPVYKVDSAKYLARGTAKGGLRDKLDKFLIDEDVNPKEYPHAFLVTAPQFLGYSFNPVSFWYLYSKDRVLSAMILEVNNTFDERRPYLVFRDFKKEKKLDSKAATDASDQSTSKISASFEKDFHVSPFNSRKGSYSVLAKDPLGPDMKSFRGLDVTINLQSSKGHPKLVARLVNQKPAIEVASMSSLQKLLFISQWFWIGFATFPRIAKEAAVLFFRRSLHVWYRPEPLKQSLGRHATSRERAIEAAFRDYLRHRVGQSTKSLRMRYAASGIGSSAEEVFNSPSAKGSRKAKLELKLQVLTPAFYSRFVHYAHDIEGLFGEMASSQTLHVENPDLLPYVFLKRVAPPIQSNKLSDIFYFTAIQGMRRAPGPIRRPLTSAETSTPQQDPAVTMTDIREFRMSSLDAHVLEHGPAEVKNAYKEAVFRIFVAERFFFGCEELTAALSWLWRIFVVCFIIPGNRAKA